MISPNDVTKGLALVFEGEPYLVLDRQHISEAGKAKVRLKLRQLRSNVRIERTVDEGPKLTVAPIERRRVIFTYWDGAWYHFRVSDTQEEIMLSLELLGEARKYLVDNLQLEVLLLNGAPVAIDLPASVVMRIKETAMPTVGAGSHYKHAIMEGPARLATGLVVLVPPFLASGDWIRVNTANGDYIERA